MYRLLILWDDGTNAEYFYETQEEAQEIEAGYYKAFGSQIEFSCIDYRPGIQKIWVSFYLQNGTQDGATLYAKDINDAERKLKEEYGDDFGSIADYGYYKEEV